MDDLVDEMFRVGGALFVTAIQIIVARTVIRCSMFILSLDV
jgi:hypothetical protein